MSLVVTADSFVREARASDAAELARIQVACWRAEYSGLVPDPVLAELTSPDAEKRFRGQWEAAARRPPTARHRVLVAVEVRGARQSAAGGAARQWEQRSEARSGTVPDSEGTGKRSRQPRQRVVAGFASCGPATDADRWPATDAEMYELDVTPELAGRGHGSRLLNAVADTVRDDGFHTLCAWALESGNGIRRFLESSGWRADGARADLDMGITVPMVRLHTAVGPAAADPATARSTAAAPTTAGSTAAGSATAGSTAADPATAGSTAADPAAADWTALSGPGRPA